MWHKVIDALCYSPESHIQADDSPCPHTRALIEAQGLLRFCQDVRFSLLDLGGCCVGHLDLYEHPVIDDRSITAVV